MASIIGIGNILIGLAYTGLGLLSAWETLSQHRYRGWSRFGVGFSLMAASCGPHHLMHGWNALRGADYSWPMLAVTLMGLPAGLSFVALRIETALGGRGDRRLEMPRHGMTGIALGLVLVAGGLAGWTLARPTSSVAQAVCSWLGLSAAPTASTAATAGAAILAANLFVVVTYGLVGWYLSDCQVRRHDAEGGWSLSGVSLSGVFFTCALMHLIYATSRCYGPTVFFDLLGVPASIYFLWVVKRVHNDSVVDWNRRPLVGAAAIPERAAPWR